MATHTPAYRKAYLANLKTEAKSNEKSLLANKGSPAAHQYMQHSGQTILGVSTFTSSVSAKGTSKGRK
jgi:hypothetical protein